MFDGQTVTNKNGWKMVTLPLNLVIEEGFEDIIGWEIQQKCGVHNQLGFKGI